MADFVRIPPDSTGKRIATEERVAIEFDNQTGTIRKGDVVTGASSGATGTVASVHVLGFAANSGRLYLEDSTGNFIDNENLEISATPVAVVDFTNNNQITFNTQHTIVSDPDNPEFQQKVDKDGATVSTFAEGSPIFAPFGELVSDGTVSLGEYDFIYGLDTHRWFDNTGTGGTVTYNSNESSAVLNTTTSAGSIAQRTTNFYHPYRPGSGQFIIMSITVGDTGKTGVRRRWGYFDDNNGVFFELDESTLYVVVRSNATGSVVDTRVQQVDFNQSPLDGSDADNFNLDVSNTNIYWMDLQWLGAGRIRFGVYDAAGGRKVAHNVQNANSIVRPWAGQATLPIRIEQENTGTPGSSSEFKLTCSSVKSFGRNERTSRFFAASRATPLSVADTDGEVPILAIRPATTFGGKPNHVSINIDTIHLNADGDFPVLVRLRKNPSSLTGASYSAANSESAAEIDTSATAITGGIEVRSGLVAANTSAFFTSIASVTETLSKIQIVLEADETTQQEFVITAQVLATGSVDITSAINWDEEQL